MTKDYGYRRNRPLHIRPLTEEDDATRFRREGWDPRKTYEENMSGESLFSDDGSLEWPELEPAPRRRKPSRAVRDLAAEGRGEDTEVAHLTPGELVVPKALQTPALMAALEQAAAAYNLPLDMLSIGNRMNRINPKTGAPEFGLLSGFGDWMSRTFGMGTANAATGTPEEDIALEPIGPLAMPPDLQNQLDKEQRRLNGEMSRRADAISALQNSNVKAALDTISETEGNTTYNTRYGKNPPFTDFSQYPGSQGGQSPSGRYQIDWKTYNDVAPQLGITDFSPQSQDLIAAYLLRQRHPDDPAPSALAHLRDGNFDGALVGASRRWASLPQGSGSNDHGRYEQPGTTYNAAKPYDKVMEIYQRNLNRLKGR